MQTEMENEVHSELTPIQRFYFGRSVFITGASGVVGKILVEKLLRCCPGLGIIYLLMRPKRGKTPEERLNKILDSELFDKVKEMYPHFRRKIRLIDGDILEPRLGISDEDFKIMKENVSVVFHSAARVLFNDPLRVAAKHNIIGAKSLVELCHELPRIAAVVHVSTAYVKREEDGSSLEKIPTTKITPKQLLDALEWMDPETELAFEKYLLEGWLTTYLVTKALCEVAVDECRGDLPTAIVRPCTISSTYRDPFPGFMDSIQGVSGLFMAGAKGVLRTLFSVKDLKIPMIPVDILANCLVISAWHVAETRPPHSFVVNSVFDYEKQPYANEFILNIALEKRTVFPLSNMYRYPDITIYYNWIPYALHSLLDEWIPAYAVDFLLYIFTGQTVLVRIYKKIHFVFDVFLKIGSKPWIWKLENYNILKNSLTDEDAKLFYLDLDNFDWYLYITNCMLGGRKFLAHEDHSNIPYAKRKARIWLTVTTILKWGLILFVFYYFLLQSFFSPFRNDDRIQEIHP